MCEGPRAPSFDRSVPPGTQRLRQEPRRDAPDACRVISKVTETNQGGWKTGGQKRKRGANLDHYSIQTWRGRAQLGIDKVSLIQCGICVTQWISVLHFCYRCFPEIVNQIITTATTKWMNTLSPCRNHNMRTDNRWDLCKWWAGICGFKLGPDQGFGPCTCSPGGWDRGGRDLVMSRAP